LTCLNFDRRSCDVYVDIRDNVYGVKYVLYLDILGLINSRFTSAVELSVLCFFNWLSNAESLLHSCRFHQLCFRIQENTFMVIASSDNESFTRLDQTVGLLKIMEIWLN